MSVRVFVDSNLLLYAKDRSHPLKQKTATAWLSALAEARAGILSAQVLREYYSVLSRKARFDVPLPQARQEILALRSWLPRDGAPDQFEDAWALQDRYLISWYDALLVAAAKWAKCDFFLSEDLQDGQSLNGVIVRDPFRHDPADTIAGRKR